MPGYFIMFVHVHPLYKDAHAVHEQISIFDLNRPEANLASQGFNDLSGIVFLSYNKMIQIWRFCTPWSHIWDIACKIDGLSACLNRSFLCKLKDFPIFIEQLCLNGGILRALIQVP